MGRKKYVEVCYDSGDRNASGLGYYPEVVIGRIRFRPAGSGNGIGYYTTKSEANRKAKEIASHLGIEAKII